MRANGGPCRRGWAGNAATHRDRAPCHLPRLLYERLDELGLDSMLAYQSSTLAYLDVWDPELAQGLARAANTAFAHEFVPFADRITPGGIIPMHTPEIASAELEYAVNELGIKSLLIAGYARRSIGRIAEEAPKLSKLVTLDQLASTPSLQPFWQRCIDLGFAPVGTAPCSTPCRAPVSIFRHPIGCLSAGLTACQVVVPWGVTARFPRTAHRLSRGGVAFACSLYKRPTCALEKPTPMPSVLDPDILDVEASCSTREVRVAEKQLRISTHCVRSTRAPSARPEQLDEFGSRDISSPTNSRWFRAQLLLRREADDRMIAWAFNDKSIHSGPPATNSAPTYRIGCSHFT